MYKSEVKHQGKVRNGQGDGNKDYFGKLSAGMFHLSVMFTECFTTSGCVAEQTEQVRKKAEKYEYEETNAPTEKVR